MSKHSLGASVLGCLHMEQTSSCEACEDPKGRLYSGLPGVLARVTADGKVTSKVERCDACELFTGDEAAERVLRAHLARLRQRKAKSKGGAGA